MEQNQGARKLMPKISFHSENFVSVILFDCMTAALFTSKSNDFRFCEHSANISKTASSLVKSAWRISAAHLAV
jgi:hypothetical protein